MGGSGIGLHDLMFISLRGRGSCLRVLRRVHELAHLEDLSTMEG